MKRFHILFWWPCPDCPVYCVYPVCGVCPVWLPQVFLPLKVLVQSFFLPVRSFTQEQSLGRNFKHSGWKQQCWFSSPFTLHFGKQRLKASEGCVEGGSTPPNDVGGGGASWSRVISQVPEQSPVGQRVAPWAEHFPAQLSPSPQWTETGVLSGRQQ